MNIYTRTLQKIINFKIEKQISLTETIIMTSRVYKVARAKTMLMILHRIVAIKLISIVQKRIKDCRWYTTLRRHARKVYVAINK